MSIITIFVIYQNKVLCVVLSFCYYFHVVLVGQNQWTSQFDAVRSYSSPRATDLNQDGILDIVLGSGVDGFASPFGAIAVNGANGNTLWTMESSNEIFSSPVFHDFNNDNIDDVIVA